MGPFLSVTVAPRGNIPATPIDHPSEGPIDPIHQSWGGIGVVKIIDTRGVRYALSICGWNAMPWSRWRCFLRASIFWLSSSPMP